MSEPRTFIFEIYKGGVLQREERLSQDVIKIGSHSKSHLFIDDSSVSRVHAVIEASGDEIHLIDLGSGRGTLLNGERINKARIGHRDKIQLGDTEIVFFTYDEKAEAAKRAAHEAAVAKAIADAKKRQVNDDTVYSRRFLSKPASTDGSVELAMLFRDFVMVDTIYQPPETVTIGPGEDADILVDHPALVGDPLPLISSDGGAVEVQFTSDFEGEIYIGTDKYTTRDIVQSGRARAAGKTIRLPLNEDVRCRLVLGEMVFFIHRSTKPKLILPFAPMDGASLIYIGVSAVLHALFMMLVFLVRPGIGDLNMDSFDPNDRFVQVLLQEEEEEPPPPPEEELFDDGEDEEQAADREAGDEGRAGDENMEETDNRMAVEGDNDMNEPTELALRQAREEASQTGAVAVLNQFGPTSLFGGEASGYDDVMAIGSVDGTNPGANYGTGGLGRYGGGLSGGGTRTGGGFGAGPIAVGGRSSGNDNLGRDRVGISREREEVRPAVVPGDPEIRGQLDREIIARVIREHRREVRACYESELQANPDLAGRIVVAFVISPDGAVASASVAESDLGSSSVESCVTRRVRRWRFPEPRGGGIVRVSYPFVFTSG